MLARDPTAADHRDLVPAVWLPDPRVRAEREQARFRLHLVKHRSMLKHRITRPAWSPDGKTIAFGSRLDAEPGFFHV
jgi:hypothetical protein